MVDSTAAQGGAYPRHIRKQLGSYYTPQYLAKSIAKETLDAWIWKQGEFTTRTSQNFKALSDSDRQSLLTKVKDIRILDPSVGDGAFLVAAADWLYEIRTNLGDINNPTNTRLQIVRNSLYGVDIVDKAIKSCVSHLQEWPHKSQEGIKDVREAISKHIRKGNSLIGSVSSNHPIESRTDSFNWYFEFTEVMKRDNPGFDIILGNPPYGNILKDEERKYIESQYPFMVGQNRTGTWNSAAHFIVRSKMLLREGGELGFLIPNSILRVNQFSKTRKFLLDAMHLWKIVDEGSPFEDVTLEMVSIFCEAIKPPIEGHIQVESRRPEHKQANKVSRDFLRSCKVFPIYHDKLYSKVLERGKRNFMTASRGRDIPKSHVVKKSVAKFSVPYITSGRSVRRYRIEDRYQSYTDSWFLKDIRLKESFETEMLVATKNFKYPRCLVKPKGVIHGGGIVEIRPSSDDVNIKALGLILNSDLIRYLCTRYLTNYSQLTTCLNTGILEDLPILEPKHPKSYEMLFNTLSMLYANPNENKECILFFEKLANSLIFELYFGSNHSLHNDVDSSLDLKQNLNPIGLCEQLSTQKISSKIESIQQIPEVQIITDELQSM